MQRRLCLIYAKKLSTNFNNRHFSSLQTLPAPAAFQPPWLQLGKRPSCTMMSLPAVMRYFSPRNFHNKNPAVALLVTKRTRSYATSAGEFTMPRDKKSEPLGFMGWFLLLVPITTFGLGTWQVQRRKWKLSLIEELHRKTTADPIDLPEDLNELRDFEYQRVRVRGEFDHSGEQLLGPRSLLVAGDASTQGSLFGSQKGNQSGVLVITPFKLADRDARILVQRGWVPNGYKDPASRKAGQIQGEVELVGVVRLPEKRAPFVPNNRPASRYWYFRDTDAMAEVCDAQPVFLDACVESSAPGGPVGGQTRVSLRNEHLSYIITWYSLSAATAYLWYRQFIQKLPLK